MTIDGRADALFEQDGHIARITLNRPTRGNVLDNDHGRSPHGVLG